MHQSDLTRNDELKVTFTRKIHDTLLFGELSGNRAEWLTPSYFIDSENSEISEKAEELTKDVNARLDKAKRIQNYIAYNIRYEIYHNASLDKASKIYKPGYGICMNTSRLYVAKCRVVGIPARTVWGIIDDGLYDSHHQWAEMLDENGFWYHTDFGYSKNFELNDVRYLDLLYAAEENDIFRNITSYRILLDNSTLQHAYLAILGEGMEFVLFQDSKPDSMIVSYT